MAAPLRTRIQAFVAALTWLTSGQASSASALHRVLEDERTRAAGDGKGRDPTDLTTWEAWRPPMEDSDGRFWLLTQSAPHAAWGHGREAERVALWLSWCDRQPAGARRIAHALARNATPWPIQTRFHAALCAALDLEGVPAHLPEPKPDTVAKLPRSTQIWLLQLTLAVGHDTWVQRLQAALDQPFPDPPVSEGMPWAGWLTLFHRGDLLPQLVGHGQPLHSGIDLGTPLFDAIDKRLLQWPKQLHKAVMGPALGTLQKFSQLLNVSVDAHERNTLIGQLKIRMGEAPPLSLDRRKNHSPLWWAVEFGNNEAFSFLLNQGGNVNETSGDQECVLSRALDQHRWTMALQLIEAGANPLNGRQQPLQTATAMEDVIARPLLRLIHVAARPLAPDEEPRFHEVARAVIAAARRSPLFVPAFQKTDNHWVHFVSLAMDAAGGDVLLAAALEGVSNAFFATFYAPNSQPKPHEVAKRTLLREAFEPNRTKHLRALAGHGVGLDFDGEFSAPLGIAIAARAPEALSAWLAVATPAELATIVRSTAPPPTPNDRKGIATAPVTTWDQGDNIWFAALHSPTPEVAIAALAQVPALRAIAHDRHPNTGRTLWQEALGQNPDRCGALDALLQHVGPIPWAPGAPLDGLGTFFLPPRHEALIERLLAAGALPLNAPIDEQGRTLLHQALALANLAQLKQLLDAGADPTVPDAEGRSALALAEQVPGAASLLAAWSAGRMAHTLEQTAGATVARRPRL